MNAFHVDFSWLHYLGVFVAALAMSAAVYRLLLHKQVLDRPNSRSSHHLPTPKGGGIGFLPVICLVLALAALPASGPDKSQLLWLAAAVLVIALLGFVDDLREVGAGKRFLAQALCSAGVLATLLGSPAFGVFSLATTAGLFVAGLLFLLWTTNLYNFMDGIDGLAAMQGILAGGTVSVLDSLGYYPGALADIGLLVAVACAAFLCFNWPPARMFMGDAGSAALGFLLAGLAATEFTHSPDALWVWVIALGGFIADSTSTLLVRFFRGEKIYQAHRSHIYQRLTQRLQARAERAGADVDRARALAHRRYLIVFTMVFVAWQLPWALLAGTGRVPGLAAALGCVVPLMAGAVLMGAGRENPAPTR